MKNVIGGLFYVDYELMMNGCVRIGDFTPVCTTEIIAFARANTYFEEKNACLIGLSVDSNPSHEV